MRSWSTLSWLALPVALYGVAVGCSSDSSSSSGEDAGTGDGGGGKSDVLVPVDQGVSGFDADDADDATACSAQTQKAIRVPVDMYIMMDSSLSMADLAENTTTTKWQAITTALGEFLGGLTSSDLGVGIQYFPLRDQATLKTCPNTIECGTTAVCLDQSPVQRMCFDKCTSAATCGTSECIKVDNINQVCSNVTCDESAYAKPEVEIGPLPGAAQDIIGSMKNHMTEFGTPTVPALKGAIAHAAQWSTTHPDHKAVVVFATDGLPTLCTFALDSSPEQQANIDAARAVAQAAAAAAPQVFTFVIGVVKANEASAKSNLDAIALAGGTQQAFMVEPNQDAVSQFRQALEKIRGQMQCEFALPQADAGTLNFMKVNVVFTPGPGLGPEQTLSFVGDVSKCAADTGGWYYDADPLSAVPTRILLCPASCNMAQSDPDSKMDIKIGCVTKVLGPK